ncbi:SMI1/KNR4 family protein [Brevibacillus fortis]|uniref:SMI1/KNR4 family protein n=1 Tax=Brevibacillus fortis TaxID=2126352 RepID=A0A2P7VIJ9_9BACL|nr:SMI1/KNR4 family protein [Brevibacillus fortis]PSJ99033.1 SMI1/KNR4 family protein [Brevibacillus fortis]
MERNICLKTLDGLKSRLDKDNTLLVQNPGGDVYQAAFSFNTPASDSDIEKFTKDTGWSIPVDFQRFIQIHNGARLFRDIKYGGGYELLSLEKIIHNHLDYMPKHWYPISVSNGDYIFIDSNRVKEGKADYLVRFDHDDDVIPENGSTMKMNFETWLERLVIAQGTEFWTW